MTNEIKTVENDATAALASVKADIAKVDAEAGTVETDVKAADSKAVTFVKAHAGAIVAVLAVVVGVILWKLI